MHKRYTDNESTFYHEVEIDPFHDGTKHFWPNITVTKRWGSLHGRPVWDPARIFVSPLDLLPGDIGYIIDALALALSEASNLDEKYPSGKEILE